MRGDTVDFGFPSMSEDPFSSSPLDKDEFDLLVGRHAMFEELERKISFKSADRILIVGEFGSGKTSFMQCLGERTNLHLSIDRIAFSEPGVELLKDMYAQLIDGSPPHDYQKLSRDLHRMIHDSRQMLPLITIDADMTDVSSLEACLRSSLHFFERLPALIIIAINPQQQSLLSEQLLQRFELRTMPSLDIDGIKALVERRIAKVSAQPYKMSTDDATKLLQLSKTGQPGALIKILRNVVSGNYDKQSSSLPLQPEPFEPEVEQFQSPLPSLAEDDIESDLDVDTDETLDDANQVPWEETPGMTEATGFDLDFELLDEPVEEPVETQEEPSFESNEAMSDDDSYVTQDSLPFAGVFGGLRGRGKIVNNELDSTPEGQFKATEKGTAFWSAEEALAIPDVEVVEEDEPHIGEEDEPETQRRLDPEDLQGLQPPVDTSLDTNAVETLSRLLAQIFRPTNQGVTGSQELVEQLRALSRPRFTQKEEHTLSIAVLSSLTSSESVVVAEAKNRNISPSDKALLEQLSIKRSRLSQICNRLHKAGILHARMVGRLRMFGLTRSALAQLIAWGIIGGDE